MSPASQLHALPNLDDPSDDAADRESQPEDALAPRTSRTSSKRPRTRGQSMVEFALMLPLLLLILALSADFGRAFTAYIAIGGAAGSGAVYGMQNLAQSQDATGIRQAALDSAPSIWGVTPTVTSSSCKAFDAQSYNCVQVTVNYTFSPIIKVPPIQNSYTLSRTVRMRVIG